MVHTKLLTLYFAALVIVLVGWVLNSAHLFWMAGTLVLLPQVSRLFGLLEHRGLRVTRELPRTGHQGERVPVRLTVRNDLPVPKLHLSLADDLPAGLRPADPEPVPVALGPRGSDQAVYELELGRRGDHRIPAVRIFSSDLLGLWKLESATPVESGIVVYPRIVQLPPRVLPPEWGGGQSPLQTIYRQGQSPSFYGVREYRPGDPLRHIHWRTAARWGRLAVVEWEAEESADVLIALETRPGTDMDLGPGTTLDLAAGLAASLAAAILGAGDSVRLLLPGTDSTAVGADRGREALPHILDALARVQATSSTSLADDLLRVAARLPAGMLLACFTATPEERLAGAMRDLQRAGLRPVLYALLASPAGDSRTAGAWSALLAELEGTGVPVMRVQRDDELTRRLLT